MTTNDTDVFEGNARLEQTAREYLKQLNTQSVPESLRLSVSPRGRWHTILRRFAAVSAVLAASIGVVTAAVITQHRHVAAPSTAVGTPAKPTLCPTVMVTPSPWPQNMSDAEKSAAIAQADQLSSDCYAAWHANLNSSTLDYNTLDHKSIIADGDARGRASTLSEATTASDMIIRGTVTSVAENPDSTSNVTLSVQRTFKGAPASTVTIKQYSHLNPDSSKPQGVVILDEYPDPLLLPGQSVIVLLQNLNGSLWIEPYTGRYYIENGYITGIGTGPSADNPFADQVSGKSEADFSALLTTAIAGP